MSLALLLGPQLRAFAAAGMDVVGVSAPGPWVAQLDGRGIRHEPLRHATRAVAVGDDVRAVAELVRLLRRLRPDIVHTHNPKPGIYGRVAARRPGCRWWSTPSTASTPPKRTPWRGATAVYGGGAVRRHVLRTPSWSRTRRTWRPSAPAGSRPASSTCSAMASTSDRFGPARRPERPRRVRAELGVGPDTVVVGLVGRLVWEKGYGELFAAAAQLRQRCPEVTVVVVGPSDRGQGRWPRTRRCRCRTRLGNVGFLGRRDDVEELYRGFDLFVLPSYREGFPRSAMEAAASGVPSIATDVRGCRQVVEDGVTGLLVPVRDAPALAAAIEELVRDEPRRRVMGEAALAKAADRIRRSSGGADDAGLYERLLQARSPRS